MRKKLLLTLMLMSPLVIASTINVKAMEANDPAKWRECVDKCQNGFNTATDGCSSIKAEAAYKRCVYEAFEAKAACVEQCKKQYPNWNK